MKVILNPDEVTSFTAGVPSGDEPKFKRKTGHLLARFKQLRPFNQPELS